VRAAFSRVAAPLEYDVGVALEIADSCVDLGEREP
jgi:hypothetical protein